MTIEIDGITDAQYLAIRDLMHIWGWCGGVGASRWTAFFADGDGNFRPKILVDGEKPRACPLGIPIKDRWKSKPDLHGEIYVLDFDQIAWALNPNK